MPDGPAGVGPHSRLSSSRCHRQRQPNSGNPPSAHFGGTVTEADEVQEHLIALRKERPSASVESVMRAVTLAGKVPEGTRLKRTTVYRLLSRTSPAPPAPCGEPDALAFTYPNANDLWTSDLMHGPRLLVPGRRDGGKMEPESAGRRFPISGPSFGRDQTQSGRALTSTRSFAALGKSSVSIFTETRLESAFSPPSKLAFRSPAPISFPASSSTATR